MDKRTALAALNGLLKKLGAPVERYGATEYIGMIENLAQQVGISAHEGHPKGWSIEQIQKFTRALRRGIATETPGGPDTPQRTKPRTRSASTPRGEGELDRERAAAQKNLRGLQQLTKVLSGPQSPSGKKHARRRTQQVTEEVLQVGSPFGGPPAEQPDFWGSAPRQALGQIAPTKPFQQGGLTQSQFGRAHGGGRHSLETEVDPHSTRMTALAGSSGAHPNFQQMNYEPHVTFQDAHAPRAAKFNSLQQSTTSSVLASGSPFAGGDQPKDIWAQPSEPTQQPIGGSHETEALRSERSRSIPIEGKIKPEELASPDWNVIAGASEDPLP